MKIRAAQSILPLVLLLCLAGAAEAVPPDMQLHYDDGVLGAVTFDGAAHAGKGFVCADCHVVSKTKRQEPKTLRDHFKGGDFQEAMCFSCHNNTRATLDCMHCHRKAPPQESPGAPQAATLEQTRSLAPDADVKPLLEGEHGAAEQTRACLSCHANTDLAPVSDRGKTLHIRLDAEALAVGAHGGLACAVCHAGSAGKDSFTKAPHKIDRVISPTCLTCHSKSMAAHIASFQQSVHYARVQEKVMCGDCHDTHTAPRKDAKKASYLAATAEMNATCLVCHADTAKLKTLSGQDMRPATSAHAFLPGWDAHIQKTMCVECHTAPDRGYDGTGKEHAVLKKEDSLRNCVACHTSSDSLIVGRAAMYAGGNSAFNISYMPGFSKFDRLDSLGKYAVIVLVLLLAVHAAGRFASAKAERVEESAQHRVFVYPGFVRVLHWLNAFFFLTLLYTGLSIHMPDAVWALGLGTAARVHNTAGPLLILNFAAYLAISVFTGDIRQYLPRCESFVVRLAAQARYYLYGIFKGEKKPFAVTRESRFNPLQQVAYLIVFILGMPVLIFSGLVLLVPGMAGSIDRECLVTVHYSLTLLYGLFLIVHIYLATTGKKISSLLKGMIDGYHDE